MVSLVFTDLHVNMTHIGKDRTLKLVRDCFFRPKMEDDVTHLVTKVCSCVKRKKPCIHNSCCSHADIYFSSTIRFDWVRLPPSWYMQWWLPVFASVNRPFLKVFFRYIQQQISLQKLKQTVYTMTLYWGMVYQERFFMTREENLRTTYFPNYQIITVSNDSEPPLTTHRQMAKLNAWTKQY